MSDSTDSSRGARERKSYGKIAKRGVAWSFFREGVSELITTPTAIIMARLLSPFDFGVAASTGVFLSLASRLTNFGFNQALVRIKHVRPEHASSVFVVTLGMGIAAYAMLVASAGPIAAFFRTPEVAQVIPVAALTFLISPFGTVPAALMSRNMQFTRTASADWMGGFSHAVSAISFAWAGYGYWSIVYGTVVGDVVNTGAKLALGRWPLSFRFSLSATRELFSFGSGVFAKRLLDYTANSLDNLVVGRVLGITALGFYDKAFATMNKVLVRISRGGPMVSFRVFSIIHEDPERFERAYRKVVMAMALLSYPVLAGLAAAGPDVLAVMYGARWLPAATAFQFLCVAGGLKIMNEYAGMAAQASGRIWNQVWRQAVYTILIVAMAAIGSQWGLSGAAAGVLVATAVMTVLMHGLLVRAHAMSSRTLLEPQIPGVVAALAVTAAVVISRAVLAGVMSAEWQFLAAEVLAAGVTYALFLKFNRFREVRRLLRDTAEDLAPPLGRIVRLMV